MLLHLYVLQSELTWWGFNNRMVHGSAGDLLRDPQIFGDVALHQDKLVFSPLSVLHSVLQETHPICLQNIPLLSSSLLKSEEEK